MFFLEAVKLLEPKGATRVRLASARLLLHVGAVPKFVSIMRRFCLEKSSPIVKWQEASVSCLRGAISRVGISFH